MFLFLLFFYLINDALVSIRDHSKPLRLSYKLLNVSIYFGTVPPHMVLSMPFKKIFIKYFIKVLIGIAG